MLQQRLKIYRRTNENYSHAQGDYFDDMESHAGQGVSGSPDNVHGSWVPVPRFVRGPWCGGSRCDARDGACAEGTGRAQGISGGAATGRERPQGGGDPVPPAKNALSAAPQGIMQDAVDASAVQAGARTYGRSFATGDCVPKGHPYTVNGTIHDQSDPEPSAETTTSDHRSTTQETHRRHAQQRSRQARRTK